MIRSSLDSDFDYLKVYLSGSTTISANSALTSESQLPDTAYPSIGLSGSTTITHNLGYVPMVRVFWDPAKNGKWYNSFADPGGARLDPWVLIRVTSTDLKIIMNTDGGAKTNIPVKYKIYDNGDVAVTSDLPVDKIFQMGSSNGSVGPAASSVVASESTITIPHTGGEAPMFTLQFSLDQVNWYTSGSRIDGTYDTASGPPGGPYTRVFWVSAYGYVDSNNLYAVIQSNYTATAKTIYIRYALDYSS